MPVPLGKLRANQKSGATISCAHAICRRARTSIDAIASRNRHNSRPLRSGMSNKSEPETFEKSLGDLEQVVEEMEKGDLSLEASLALYERGIALSDQCQKRLNDAERKVRILSERDGEVQLEQYDEDDASE